jgi:hypothetical protein
MPSIELTEVGPRKGSASSRISARVQHSLTREAAVANAFVAADSDTGHPGQVPYGEYVSDFDVRSSALSRVTPGRAAAPPIVDRSAARPLR